ncbi:unnamed protein product [Ectocarpus fasciculatus]
MIRDHLTPGSTVTGVHSRLVLLWQNSVEADLYCTDELTALQAKANGLLEVTALISGDITRRNIPGNAFRRAKARLMKKGAAAGLVSRGEREVDSDTWDAKHDDDDGHDAALPSNLPRLWSVSELSRVSEEDSTHTRGSKSIRSLGVFASGGSRDLETGGGGGGGGDLGRENNIGEAKRAGGGGDVPWSASDTAADTRSKAGRHRQHGGGGGRGGGGYSGGLTTSSSGVARNPRSTSFAGGAHIWSSEEKTGQGQKSRSDNDGVPRGTLIAGRRGSGGGRSVDTDWGSTRGKSPARNSTGGPSGSSGGSLGGDNARSGIRVADSIRAAGLDRGPWSKKKARGRKLKLYSYTDGDDDGGGGGSGGGRSKPTAPRFHSSYRSKTGTGDDVAGSGQGRQSKAVGVRRKGRRWASRDRSAMRGAGQPGGSPLDDSGTGLQHSKLTVEILERVLGEPVMTAVLATKEAEVRVPATSELHPPYNINGMTDALRELVGTETSSGRLQVVVSGPGGFVFHVEGLLADLQIPPEAVVTLD